METWMENLDGTMFLVTMVFWPWPISSSVGVGVGPKTTNETFHRSRGCRLDENALMATWTETLDGNHDGTFFWSPSIRLGISSLIFRQDPAVV
jgi:hypothetical protein